VTIPHLTRVRWQILLALRNNRVLQNRPFLAKELMVKHHSRSRPGEFYMRPAAGMSMITLEQAGWVERTTWGAKGQRMPFQSGGPLSAWQLTDAGRAAIAACPDTFPGEPVYRKSRTNPTPLNAESI
jgi:hypothetical protein